MHHYISLLTKTSAKHFNKKYKYNLTTMLIIYAVLELIHNLLDLTQCFLIIILLECFERLQCEMKWQYKYRIQIPFQKVTCWKISSQWEIVINSTLLCPRGRFRSGKTGNLISLIRDKNFFLFIILSRFILPWICQSYRDDHCIMRLKLFAGKVIAWISLCW